MDYLLEQWPFSTAAILGCLLVSGILMVNLYLIRQRIERNLDAWVDASDILLTKFGFKEQDDEEGTYSLDWVDCDPRWNEHVLARFRSKGYFIYMIANVDASPHIDSTHTHIMFYGTGDKHVAFKVNPESK